MERESESMSMLSQQIPIVKPFAHTYTIWAKTCEMCNKNAYDNKVPRFAFPTLFILSDRRMQFFSALFRSIRDDKRSKNTAHSIVNASVLALFSFNSFHFFFA